MLGMPLPFFLFVTRLQLGLSRYDPPREPHATRENESRREIRGRGSIDRPTLSEDKSLGDGNLDRPNVSVDRSFGGGNLDGRGLSHIRERGMSSRLPMLPMHKYSPMSTPDGLDVAYAPSKPTSSSGEYFGGEGGGGHTGIVYPLVDLVGVDRVRSWADAIMLLNIKVIYGTAQDGLEVGIRTQQLKQEARCQFIRSYFICTTYYTVYPNTKRKILLSGGLNKMVI